MSSGQTMGNHHYEQKWSQSSYARTINAVSDRFDGRTLDEKEQIQQTLYNLFNTNAIYCNNQNWK